MRLAERALDRPVAKAAVQGAPVRIREIRRLCDGSDHQTAIVTTVQQGLMTTLAPQMFARWSQENFFKYGERELSIDRLAGYALASAAEHETLKNPAHTAVDARIRRLRAEEAKLQAQRGQLVLATSDGEAVKAHINACEPMDQRLEALATELKDQRTLRRTLPKRIALKDVPESQRPQFIAPARTQFLNSIRITAYRAETALALILREHLARHDDARSTLQGLFRHDADLVPNLHDRTLTVRVHHFTNPQTSIAMKAVLATLTESETVYPGTDLVLRYELVSDPSPTGQEV